MELPRRRADDVYLPNGAFQHLVGAFQQRESLHDIRIVIVYAFDFRTRMLPYWYADKRMAPCSVRLLADTLDACGFKHIRVVLQQWTPNFKPSQALLDGKRPDILLVSAMQVHAEPSYDLVRDAHTLGADRPLILAGGPKAIYEPTDYFDLGPGEKVGADCVVTGEAYVLLDLLNRIAENHRPGISMLEAFDNARSSGSLRDTPGLVFLNPNSDHQQPLAINTGVQRLLQNLDELPMPDAGYRLLEPAHRRATLSPRPLLPKQVGKLSVVSSIISTHGCKFNCDFCPIPAVNQRTWRHKSATRLADEIAHIYENFGIVEFFSTDDNFFNTRDTVIDLMTALSEKTLSDGRPLGQCIRFYTEATEFDVHKNRDILPLCKKAGLSAIWFGIEDMAAILINKGQTEGKTDELFAYMCELGIEPMVMMIHNDDQPLHSGEDNMTGLVNQAKYAFEKGAVSYQCTYLSPAVGTRTFEPMARAKMLYRTVAGDPIPQAYQDGNHVVASKSETPWERQVNVLRAYFTFYNPMNTARIIMNRKRDRLWPKRLVFQAAGQIGLLLTFPKLWRWARKLKKGPIQVWEGLVPARIPMCSPHTGQEVQWAIEHTPAPSLSPWPADVCVTDGAASPQAADHTMPTAVS